MLLHKQREADLKSFEIINKYSLYESLFLRTFLQFYILTYAVKKQGTSSITSVTNICLNIQRKCSGPIFIKVLF